MQGGGGSITPETIALLLPRSGMPVDGSHTTTPDGSVYPARGMPSWVFSTWLCSTGSEGGGTLHCPDTTGISAGGESPFSLSYIVTPTPLCCNVSFVCSFAFLVLQFLGRLFSCKINIDKRLKYIFPLPIHKFTHGSSRKK